MRNNRVWLVWIEGVVAAATGALGIVTIAWRGRIEALAGWSPDHHSGGFEVSLIAVLLAVNALSAAEARRTARQLRERAAA